MLSKKKLLSKGLLVVLFAVLLISGLGVILRSAHAAPSVTPIYNYTGPTLRLPWLYGSYPISQSYNCTDHTTGTKDQFAIDFGFGSGNQVQLTAVFAGTIHYGTYDSGGYGNSLWITNGNWKAVYAHLGTSQTDNGIQVANNKPVVQGQKIAMSGWTGWVSPAGPAGAHLHFSLRYKTSELTNQYDGDPVRPEPMSGYGIGGNGVSFGDYGKCGTRGNGLFNPGPGGFWIGPTPRGKYTDTNGVIHYNPIRAGTLVNLGFQAHDNNNRGLQYVHFTKSQDNGNTWSILPIDSTKNVSNGDVQYFAHFTMPNVPVILSADVGSKNGSFQLAPNGLRYFCLSNTQCPTELIVYNGPDGKGYGGGGGTPPPPTEGVTVCQNTNYASPCETFHYTTDDVCISLDQMSGYNKSVQDINNAYSIIMYHDTGCGTYLARYDASNPDIGSGLYNQFSSMKLEKHLPPKAQQTYPASSAVLPVGTTTLGVTFQNGNVFTVHVWGPNYDVWQGNINATWLTINGLQNGATYQWQVQGTDQYGTGPWSPTWTFTVADNAKQVSPDNGTSFPSGTTEVKVTFSGQSPFTLHVWGPNFDLWQENIADTFYQVTGLPVAGGTFNWQIIGSSGPWSDTWTFKANPPSNAAPCGKWISPNNDSYVLTKGTPQVITVRAYPCNLGDAAISHVAFMIGTPDRGIDNMSVLCIVNTPDAGTQDQYSCKTDGQTTDGQYMPAGDILISFNVDNTNDVESDFPDGALMGTQQ